MARRILLVHREHAAVLVSQDELDQPVLQRLEAARGPEHVTELAVFGRRQGLQDRPLGDELGLDVLDPREDLERRLELVAPDEGERRAQLVQDQLEPQLARLVLDDEEHLVMVGRIAQRHLRRQQLVELQVSAVRHSIAEIGDHPVFEGHGRPSITRAGWPDARSGGAYQRATDPWVSIAPDGTAYQITYAFDWDRVNRAMLVSRSTDRGLTWESPITLQRDRDPDFMMDKETVTADPLDANFAYAVWDRLAGFTIPNNPLGTGPAWFARTTNRGESWEAPRQIYDPGPDTQTVSNQIVVLPDHTLVNSSMVVTENSSTSPHVSIAVMRSADHGASWPAPPVTVAEAAVVGVNDPKSNLGIRTGSGVHSIAVDRESGPNGPIYVAWG